MHVVWALAERELRRFFRQRNRLVGAVAQPLIFWALFSAGLGPSFRVSGAAGDAVGASYAAYFFPGVIAMMLLFTAIFTTISVIEDRREGFLQSVLVAPAPRWAMVLGKLLGTSIIATLQGLLFLGLGWFLDVRFGPVQGLVIVAFMFVFTFGLAGLGFVIAWRMDSTQGFHAIMSVFLFPMWLLSGAFFPAREGWLAWVLAINPMTYGVAGLRRLLYSGAGDEAAAVLAGLPSTTVCWMVIGIFAGAMFAVSCAIAGTRTTGDLL